MKMWFNILGLLEGTGYLSSVFLILPLLWGLCALCAESCEEILHEAILPVCLDTCCSTYCCDTILPHNKEHLRRINLVYSTCLDDYLQWHNGICVWVLLRKDTSDQAFAKENLGRIHWWRILYCNIWLYCKYTNVYIHILY